MRDRNKTQLTHDVTGATARWLEERGMKPVETEVSVELGWCADLAAVWCPTQTELIAAGFLKRPPGWNDLHSLKRSEAHRAASVGKLADWEEQYKKLDRAMTVLVEVKTSRGDFRGDRKWTAALPCDLAYVVVPKGMISSEEWPAGWGVLEYGENGVRRLRNPTPVQTTSEQQFSVVLNIAIRRDHHTRYERWRERQKEDRLREGEEKTLRRVSDIARLLVRVTKAERNTLDELLSWYGYTKLDRWTKEQLQELWGIAKKQEESAA